MRIHQVKMMNYKERHRTESMAPQPEGAFALVTCSHCQSRFPDDSSFCGHCGNRLTAEGDESLAVEEDAYTEPEAEWTPPDEEALHQITNTVAQGLVQGEDKEKVAEWLVNGHGWPEVLATGFVDRVEHERQERMLKRRLIRWLVGTNPYILLFAAIAGGMFAILGMPGAMGGALVAVIGYPLVKVVRFYRAKKDK